MLYPPSTRRLLILTFHFYPLPVSSCVPDRCFAHTMLPRNSPPITTNHMGHRVNSKNEDTILSIKKTHRLGFDNKALTLTLPLTWHDTLRMNLNFSGSLISKIECGHHENSPLKSPTAWSVIDWGPQSHCLKSFTSLATQSLKEARSLLGEAGTLLGDVRLHRAMT